MTSETDGGGERGVAEAQARLRPLIAAGFASAAAALDIAWHAAAPAKMGEGEWDRLMGCPGEPGPLAAFYGTAPAMVETLLKVATELDPESVVETIRSYEGMTRREPARDEAAPAARGDRTPFDPTDPKDCAAVQDALLSAGVPVTLAQVGAWKPDMLTRAYEWAVDAVRPNAATVQKEKPDFIQVPEWRKI